MQIFLSYPHKDKDKSLQLRNILVSGGHVVWTDEQLITGTAWRQALETEIKRADALAIALTPRWLASPYCQWEFMTAVENEKKVIPVMLDSVEALPDRLSQYQFADLTDGLQDHAKTEKLLNDLVFLAATIDKSRIATMDKQAIAADVDQARQAGEYNVSGSGNTVIGSQTKDNHANIQFTGSTINAGNVNVGGEQTFAGSVTIGTPTGAPSAASTDPRSMAETLLAQLVNNLSNLRPDQKDDGDAVQTVAEETMREIRKDKPNPKLLALKANNLKSVAQSLPTIAPIAGKIADMLLLIK